MKKKVVTGSHYANNDKPVVERTSCFLLFYKIKIEYQNLVDKVLFAI